MKREEINRRGRDFFFERNEKLWQWGFGGTCINISLSVGLSSYYFFLFMMFRETSCSMPLRMGAMNIDSGLHNHHRY